MNKHEQLSVFAGLAVVKILLVMFAVTVFLAGCAQDVPPSKLAGPPKHLMAPPKKFPPVNEGDDAVAKLAQAAELHNRESRCLRGLQGYVKTIRKE